MPKEFDLVVEFENLRILFLSKLIPVGLIDIVLLSIVIVIIVVIILVEEVIIIVSAVQIRSLDKVIIIFVYNVLHGVILGKFKFLHCPIYLVVIKRGLNIEYTTTLTRLNFYSVHFQGISNRFNLVSLPC